MHNILPRLYLGDLADAEGVQFQSQAPIDAVVTLCETKPLVPEAYTHIHLPMPDEVYLDVFVWQWRIDMLRMLFGQRHTVLVHCRLGVSRAPSLVAAYLAYSGIELTPATALDRLKQIRPAVNPHVETWRGVLDWWSSR